MDNQLVEEARAKLAASVARVAADPSLVLVDTLTITPAQAAEQLAAQSADASTNAKALLDDIAAAPDQPAGE